MTRAAVSARIAATGARPRRAVVLAVAVTLLGGWLLLGLRAALPDAMTPAAFLAAPALWPGHLPAALAASLPDWAGRSLAGAASGMMLFLTAAGLRLVLMAIGPAHGALVGALAAVGAAAALLAAQAGEPGALAAAALAVPLAALAVTGAARSAGQSGAASRLVALAAMLAALFVLGRGWPSGLPVLARPAVIAGTIGWQGQRLAQFHLLALGIGLVAAAGLWLGLHATRGGLLLRARQDNPAMAAALGHGAVGPGLAAIIAGIGLALLGAALWALDQSAPGAGSGGALLLMLLATVFLGGSGPPGACLPAGVLVGLAGAYGAALAPPPLALLPVGVLLLAGLARRD